MDEFDGHEPLRIGFIPASESADLGNLGEVSVPDLANVLLAYQRIVYATAAYDLHLPSARHLSEEQRKTYTLSVVAFKQGSFWAEILPWIVAHKEEMETVIAPAVISGLLINLAWAAIAHSTNALKKVFEKDDKEEEEDKRLAAAILPHAVTLAKTVLGSNQMVSLSYHDRAGTEFTLQITPVNSLGVLARDAMEQGELEEYKDCVIRDIQTTQPIITVTSPNYPRKPIPCQYDERDPHARGFTHSLKVDDIITVIGWPIRSSRARKNIAPTLVRIRQLRNAAGQIIVSFYEQPLPKAPRGRPRKQDDLFST